MITAPFLSMGHPEDLQCTSWMYTHCCLLMLSHMTGSFITLKDLWSDWTPNIRWSFITDIKHTANLIAAFRWTKETKFGPSCLYLLCVKPFLHVLWVKWPEPAAWPLTLNRVCTAHSTTCCSDTMTADVLHICFLLYSVQPTIHFHTFIHNF